jgi:5-(hydroxymethyl)furfural/furfural oxidase
MRIAAREIVLSAGALQSPALLMRAGIGPGEHLRELGVPVLHELRGVGANLQDHPALTFCQYLSPRWRLPQGMRRASMTAARLSSGLPGCEDQDLYLSSAGRASWHALGSRLGLFFLWCNRPYSRGSVRLESPDPRRHPRVELNLLDDPRDAARLVAGVRFLERALRGSELQAGPGELFPASFSPRVRALSRLGPRNRVLTAAVAGLLDLQPRVARRAMLRRMFAGELALDALVDDEAQLLRMVRRNVFGVWHPSGTCRMGAAGDPLAVTDPQGRVHGMKGLRVVDASLMPRLPTANTNVPTIMMAEKIAHEMLGRRAGEAPGGLEAIHA